MWGRCNHLESWSPFLHVIFIKGIECFNAASILLLVQDTRDEIDINKIIVLLCIYSLSTWYHNTWSDLSDVFAYYKQLAINKATILNLKWYSSSAHKLHSQKWQVPAHALWYSYCTFPVIKKKTDTSGDLYGYQLAIAIMPKLVLVHMLVV